MRDRMDYLLYTAMVKRRSSVHGLVPCTEWGTLLEIRLGTSFVRDKLHAARGRYVGASCRTPGTQPATLATVRSLHLRTNASLLQS
jgi:hypothetical protein